MIYPFSFKNSLKILAFVSVFSISMPAFSLFNIGIEATGSPLSLTNGDFISGSQKHQRNAISYQWGAAFFIEHDVLPFLPNYQFSYSKNSPYKKSNDTLASSNASHLFYFNLIKSSAFNITGGFDYQILSLQNQSKSIKDNASALHLGVDLLLPFIQPSLNISIPLSSNIRKTSADARISTTVLPLLLVKGKLMLGYRYDHYHMSDQNLTGDLNDHLFYLGASLTLGL